MEKEYQSRVQRSLCNSIIILSFTALLKVLWSHHPYTSGEMSSHNTFLGLNKAATAGQ